METPKARQIHGQAEQARENGDFQKALQLSDQAMIAYQKEGDSQGFAEVLSSRFLTLRHLYEETNDQNYIILAKHTVIASVEIGRKSGNPKSLALPLFNLAKSQEILEENEEACKSYQEALDNMTNNPPDQHNRPAVLADIKIHLYISQAKNGDQSSLEKAIDALKELESSDEEKYNKDVWLSGAHMKLAEILSVTNPKAAKEHLQKAKVIIDNNPDLKLRAKQLEKLTEKLKS